jgi:hypothetical protein
MNLIDHYMHAKILKFPRATVFTSFFLLFILT